MVAQIWSMYSANAKSAIKKTTKNRGTQEQNAQSIEQSIQLGEGEKIPT